MFSRGFKYLKILPKINIYNKVNIYKKPKIHSFIKPVPMRNFSTKPTNPVKVNILEENG